MSADSLLDALQNRGSESPLTVCKFSQIRSLLNEEEQSALDKAVDSIRDEIGAGKAKMYSATWLSKVLRTFGYDISVSTVQRHVNKECSCERVVR